MPTGTAPPNLKLTRRVVREILRALKRGRRVSGTHADIAARVGVNVRLVDNISRGIFPKSYRRRGKCPACHRSFNADGFCTICEALAYRAKFGGDGTDLDAGGIDLDYDLPPTAVVRVAQIRAQKAIRRGGMDSIHTDQTGWRGRVCKIHEDGRVTR